MRTLALVVLLAVLAAPAAAVEVGPAPMPASWATVGLTGPVITYSGTLPDSTGCGGAHSRANSWMRLELWFQKQQPAWWPPFYPKYAPVFVAASRDTAPGCVASIVLPDTFSTGTLLGRARGPAGLGCDSNYISSWNHPWGP